MKKYTPLFIEHCEPQLSEWLMLEYKHSTKLWPNETWFTKVNDEKTANKLKKLGKVEKKKANQILHDKKCIILDPLADKTLKTTDFKQLDAIIVGGILGYKKPRGRTKKLLSDKSDFETRNIGSIQLTIDGAVFVAKAIMLGMKLTDIEIAYELEIIHVKRYSTILPFGYPIIKDTPIITPGLVEYLNKKIY